MMSSKAHDGSRLFLLMAVSIAIGSSGLPAHAMPIPADLNMVLAPTAVEDVPLETMPTDQKAININEVNQSTQAAGGGGGTGKTTTGDDVKSFSWGMHPELMNTGDSEHGAGGGGGAGKGTTNASLNFTRTDALTGGGGGAGKARLNEFAADVRMCDGSVRNALPTNGNINPTMINSNQAGGLGRGTEGALLPAVRPVGAADFHAITNLGGAAGLGAAGIGTGGAANASLNLTNIGAANLGATLGGAGKGSGGAANASLNFTNVNAGSLNFSNQAHGGGGGSGISAAGLSHSNASLNFSRGATPNLNLGNVMFGK